MGVSIGAYRDGAETCLILCSSRWVSENNKGE